MTDFKPHYQAGTIRLCPPEQTLARVLPHLSDLGVTRLADLTRMDADLGFPTFAAIRPTGRVLQCSSGKGSTPTEAKVSALMEAVELHHAENPETDRFVTASMNELDRANGITPKQLDPTFNGYFTPDFRIPWIEAEDLLQPRKVMLPAESCFFMPRALGQVSTNGLATGNHVIEATLHALYELLERHVVSGLLQDGKLMLDHVDILDCDTLTDDHLIRARQKIEAAGSTFVLMHIRSPLPIHTFWAVLLNHQPHSALSRVNVGYGAHRNAVIAAKRALGEAVQSRLVLIQGCREDMVDMPVYRAGNLDGGSAFNFFNQRRPNATWPQINPNTDLEPLDQTLEHLRQALREQGFPALYRVDLSHAERNIPVVKLFLQGARFIGRLF